MLFSQRKCFKDFHNVIQNDSMDKDLRCGLWTALYECIWSRFEGSIPNSNTIARSNLDQLFKRLWHLYFKYPIDNLDHFFIDALKRVRKYFFQCEWFEAYDMVEFISKNCPESFRNKLRAFCNDVLERENSAYRFVDKEIVEISSPIEIESIEEAIEKSSRWFGVRRHLKASLSLLSDRKNHDYRNSIKESISAVEAISKLISKKPDATLGFALKVIEGSIIIHPALKKSILSLYGYTSDADGIRHALLDEENLTYSDAKFMLVSCTAFINYLISKVSEAGIKLGKNS